MPSPEQRRAASAPQRTVPSPEQRRAAPVPQRTVPSPGQRRQVPAPQRTVPSPEQRRPAPAPQQTVPSPEQRRAAPVSEADRGKSTKSDKRLDKILSSISQSHDGMLENLASNPKLAHKHAGDFLRELSNLKFRYPEKYEEKKSQYEQNKLFAKEFVLRMDKKEEVDNLLKTNETIASHRSLTPETRLAAAKVLLETLKENRSSIAPEESARLSELAKTVIRRTSRKIQSSSATEQASLSPEEQSKAKRDINELQDVITSQFTDSEKVLEAKVKLHDALSKLPEDALSPQERFVAQSRANEGLVEMMQQFDKYRDTINDPQASDRSVVNAANLLKDTLTKIPDSVISPQDKQFHLQQADQAIRRIGNQKSKDVDEIKKLYSTIISRDSTTKDVLGAATRLRGLLTDSVKRNLEPDFKGNCERAIEYASNRAITDIMSLESVINDNGSNRSTASERFEAIAKLKDLLPHVPAHILSREEKQQKVFNADNAYSQILRSEIPRLERAMKPSLSSSNRSRGEAAKELKGILENAPEGFIRRDYKQALLAKANEQIQKSAEKLRAVNRRERVQESSAPRRRGGMGVGGRGR